MRTIYKYKLPRDGQSIIIEEYILEVLHIGTQDGWPMLWAVVDTDKYQETEVVAWGTGWPLPDDVYYETDYWGTAEDAAGYIWHYFAATRSSDTSTLNLRNEQTDYDYAKIADLSSSGSPYQPYTISISCGDASSAVDGLICDKITYDPSWTTSCTGTISTGTYNNNYKVDVDRLVGMIEKYVGNSNTATNASVR